jgi:excisionase family DNA binding protein
MKLQSSIIPQLDERQRYTIAEACALLRQSRAKIYKDIRNGTIETLTDGRRRYVTGRSIVARSRPEGDGADRANAA